MKIVFAEKVVETNLGAGSWGQVWRHQLRWARTIRVSRPGGYYGYMVTHATLWCLVAWLGGAWPVAAVTMALRLAAGALTSVRVLGDRRGWRDLWLMPLRDMLGFATWLAGIRGDIIEWRGERMRLTREGKMEIAGNITARSKP
jgi:ceramide glucosyltransferase